VDLYHSEQHVSAIHCNQCGAAFVPTQEELARGMSFCPGCGNGIQIRQTSKPQVDSLELKSRASCFGEGMMLFTEQGVRDVFFAGQIDRIRYSEEGMSLNQAIWEWADGKAAPDEDYLTNVKRLMKTGGARYKIAQDLIQVAKLSYCERKGGQGDLGIAGEDAPLVTIQWRRRVYDATLEAKPILFTRVAQMYGYAPMHLLIAIQRGNLPARKSEGTFLVTVSDVERCIAMGVLEPLRSSRFAGKVMGVGYRIIVHPWGAKLQLLVESVPDACSLVLAWMYAGMKSVSFGSDIARAVLAGQKQEVQARIKEWASELVAEYEAMSRSRKTPVYYDAEDEYQRLIELSQDPTSGFRIDDW